MAAARSPLLGESVSPVLYSQSPPLGAQSPAICSPTGKRCRICFQPDALSGFVAPCRCAGSMKWVHQGCLREWRVVSKRSDSFWRCEQCCTAYSFRRGPLLAILKNGALRAALVALAVACAFGAMYALVSYVLDAHETVVRLQVERMQVVGGPHRDWYGAYDAAMASLSPRTTEASVATAVYPTPGDVLSDAPLHVSPVAAALRTFGISRIFYPVPLAVACLGFVALFAENHAGSSLAGILLAISTAMLYVHPSPLVTFVYPLPAAFGVVSFVAGVHAAVAGVLDFVLRRYCSELLDHASAP